eukprot:24077_1
MPSIERSPNNRAGCRNCHQKILKDTYRIGVSVSSYRHTTTHWYHSNCYHSNCYPKSSGVRPPSVSGDLFGYKKLPESEKRILRKALWPNQASDKNKPRLKLLKEFNKMTVKDLKLELERRDLRRNGKKQQLKDRLEKYLNNNKCKKANEKLVFGYCKTKETKHNIIVPMYLQQIVHKYFPPCV